MKVLYYFQKYNTVMYNWQVENFVAEMKMNNCEIEIFNPLLFETVDIANEKVVEKIKSIKYDLFMTCHNEEILYISTLKEIKKSGIPTLLFCPDNLLAPFNHENIANLFDLVWLTSKETKYLFDKWGCRSVFLPYAANPYLYKPDYSMDEISALGFIGTPHGTRMDHINTLVDAGIHVVVHTASTNMQQPIVSTSAKNYVKAVKNYVRYPIGRKLLVASVIDKSKKRMFHLDNPCLQIEKPVPFAEMAKYSCAYAAMLSFTDARSTGVLTHPVPIINLRHFELPMSGALQFTTYSDELASYFEENKEIILCRDRNEYIEKARYWLQDKNESKRKQMKIAARNRAVREHTWNNRFQTIFELLGLSIEKGASCIIKNVDVEN